MGLKVCPRTGMIIRGPVRPPRPPQSPHVVRLKKTNNMFPAHPFPQGSTIEAVVVQQSQGLTAEQLQQLATKIGKTIAAQIGNVQSQAYPVGQLQANRAAETKVDIDESIIDVGIGEQDPLEKGAGSGKIVKEATVKDDIAGSKQALKAIKAG